MWHLKKGFKSRQKLSSAWHGSHCIHCTPLSLRMRFCMHITQNIILKSSQTKAEDMEVEMRMKSPQNRSARSGKISKTEKGMWVYRKKKKKVWVINTESQYAKGGAGKYWNESQSSGKVQLSLALCVNGDSIGTSQPEIMSQHWDSWESIRLPSLLI